MPRRWLRTTQRGLTYSKSTLHDAVSAVRDGMLLSTAAKEFNVPRNTIRRHLEGDVQIYGGKPILSVKQEAILIERIGYMADRGFPLTRKDVMEIAFHYVATLHRRKQCALPQKWKITRQASPDWWDSFKRRHPEITLRVAENISTARAEAFNPERIGKFFEDCRTVFDSLKMDRYPDLLYNCDETGLSTVPGTSRKVVAFKGSRPQKTQVSERGVLTTFLPCCNAQGDFIPPVLIFKGHGLPQTTDFPADTRIFGSKSGYIDQEIFLKFLEHFETYRCKVPGKKCILFMDGHSSHLTVEAINFCVDHDIEILCLPPHSSHRLQPLDTHFNKPMKASWADEVKRYLSQSEKVVLTKYEFGKVFSRVWASMQTKNDLIRRGFDHCGLFPLRNPTSKADFYLSQAYQNCSADDGREMTPSTSGCVSVEQGTTLNVQGTSHERSDDAQATCLKRLLPSPRKAKSHVHSSDHTTHVTSPENVVSKRQKRRKSEEAKTSKKASFLKTNATKGKSDVEEPAFCCVCRDQWGSTPGEEWLCLSLIHI